MIAWLRSEEIEKLSSQEDWPTAQTRHDWLEFYLGKMNGDQRKWAREIQSVSVQWEGPPRVSGVHVVLEPKHGLVLTRDLVKLGVLKSIVSRPRQNIVSSRVGHSPGIVVVEFFGPREEP